jgi:hypothetical protein
MHLNLTYAYRPPTTIERCSLVAELKYLYQAFDLQLLNVLRTSRRPRQYYSHISRSLLSHLLLHPDPFAQLLRKWEGHEDHIIALFATVGLGDGVCTRGA